MTEDAHLRPESEQMTEKALPVNKGVVEAFEELITEILSTRDTRETGFGGTVGGTIGQENLKDLYARVSHGYYAQVLKRAKEQLTDGSEARRG